MKCHITTIAIPILGLTVGFDRKIYSTKEGHLTFVRGNYSPDQDEGEDIPAVATDENEHVTDEDNFTCDKYKVTNSKDTKKA